MPSSVKGNSTDDTQSCPESAYDLERVKVVFQGVKRRHTSIVGRYLLKNTPTSVAKTDTAINTRSSTVQGLQRLRAFSLNIGILTSLPGSWNPLRVIYPNSSDQYLSTSLFSNKFMKRHGLQVGEIRTKVTDRLIVHTPTMVSQPLIHDDKSRCLGEVRR